MVPDPWLHRLVELMESHWHANIATVAVLEPLVEPADHIMLPWLASPMPPTDGSTKWLCLWSHHIDTHSCTSATTSPLQYCNNCWKSSNNSSAWLAQWLQACLDFFFFFFSTSCQRCHYGSFRPCHIRQAWWSPISAQHLLASMEVDEWYQPLGMSNVVKARVWL